MDSIPRGALKAAPLCKTRRVWTARTAADGNGRQPTHLCGGRKRDGQQQDEDAHLERTLAGFGFRSFHSGKIMCEGCLMTLCHFGGKWGVEGGCCKSKLAQGLGPVGILKRDTVRTHCESGTPHNSGRVWKRRAHKAFFSAFTFCLFSFF